MSCTPVETAQRLIQKIKPETNLAKVKNRVRSWSNWRLPMAAQTRKGARTTRQLKSRSGQTLEC